MKAKRKGMGCVVVLFFLVAVVPQAVLHAEMKDYCMRPPFIEGVIQPNLLLMLDNSGSMYDLAYVDEGVRAANGTFVRKPAYCYDETYRSGVSYYGYFDKTAIYNYDFGTNSFSVVTDFNGECFTAGDLVRTRPGTICVKLSADKTDVTYFAAKGNFLNWLGGSKVDVQKGILTGGKFVEKMCSGSTASNMRSCSGNSDCLSTETCVDVADRLIAESRGCVGRKFVKEPLTADYVEGGTNTSLGIAFGVRGPVDSGHSTGLSPGGQTFIEVFLGDYNQQLCQEAIRAFTELNNPADIKKAVDDCLSYTTSPATFCSLHPELSCTKKSDCPDWKTLGETCVTPTATTEAKQKVVFGQSIQACWAYLRGLQPIGNDETLTVRNQCPDLYDENKICIGGAQDGKVCSASGDCPSGACLNGPGVIRPGNPSLLCSDQYTGYCASTLNNWGTTTWHSREFATADACIIKKHEEFCNALDIPPVIDPTDDPSDTASFDNLPAIISDIGIEAQLNPPIKTLTIRTAFRRHCSRTTETACSSVSDCPDAERCLEKPEGVLHNYRNSARFGLMTFNDNGSPTECGTAGANVPCPKYCSNDASRPCTTALDCGGAACNATVKNVSNLDGGVIKSYIGAPVGDHGTGLIKSVDDMRGTTWTPYAEAFYNATGYFAQRTDLRINANDFTTATELNDATKNPTQFVCQRNNVLMIADGMSTTDAHTDVIARATSAGTTPKTCKYLGSTGLSQLAWLAKNKSIKDSTKDPANPSDSMATYVVYTGEKVVNTDDCNPYNLLQQTATNGSSRCTLSADKLYYAKTPEALRQALDELLLCISSGVASGTAASVLASSTGQGANLLQAVFYPKRTSADSVEAAWLGEMQNVWFIVDPLLQTSTIRAESSNPKNTELNTTEDRVIAFVFDPSESRTKVVSASSTVNFEDFHDNLWEAGGLLWKRELSSSPRKILTTTNTTVSTLTELKIDDDPTASTFKALLQAEGPDDTAKTAHAKKIISYTHGLDEPGYRERKVRARTDAGVLATRVWRLGDIVSSTPKVAGLTPANTYHLTPPGGYNDASYQKYISSKDYEDRTIAFVGSNDGMLHAFNFGKLRTVNTNTVKARLEGTNLGREEWAFIPKNALPYLKYLTDPNYCHLYYVDSPTLLVDASVHIPEGCSETEYAKCDKKTTVDGTTKKVDLDKTSWRTILIGGMGLGGACKNAGASCPADLNGDGSADDKDCVRTPIDNVGFSSYFALDVTETVVDPSKAPKLLWEFPDPGRTDHAEAFESDGASRLGFSLSGPAVVRIAATGTAANTEKNGHWFVVFGSGPTGPVDKDHLQFGGKSDQNLRYFVLNLKTGALEATLQPATPIQNGFSGSLFASTLDADRWDRESTGFYQDDAVYAGYTKKASTGSEWNEGGVLRILTKEDPNPGNWAVTTLLDGIGPVTSAVAKLQDIRNGNLWLFAGTGRYFFRYESTVDSPGSAASSDRQHLYGVKDPCYTATGNNIDKTCTTSVSVSDLEDRTSDLSRTAVASGKAGWDITLGGPVDDASGKLHAERVITTPVAGFTGAVFFTTFAPSTEVCDFGGSTFIWGLDFQSGGRAQELALKGTALVQVSTGEIKQIDFSKAFKAADGADTKKSASIKGAPPFPAPPLVIIPPRPTEANNRVIHVIEK